MVPFICNGLAPVMVSACTGPMSMSSMFSANSRTVSELLLDCQSSAGQELHQ
jgi:hypothetical protein